MSIDPALLSLTPEHNGEPPLPDVPLWPAELPQVGSLVSDNTLHPLSTREEFEADAVRHDELMKEVGYSGTVQGGWSDDCQQIPDNVWDGHVFPQFHDATDLDAARRRSKSQPPSLGQEVQPLSPANQPIAIVPGPRPGMMRSASAVPKRFHPYTHGSRFKSHQRSYTSHPSIGPNAGGLQGGIGWATPIDMSKPIIQPRITDRTQASPSAPAIGTREMPKDRLLNAGMDESYGFHLYHDQTSLALGLQTQLKLLQDQCSDMQLFLAASFSPGGDCNAQYAQRNEIERKRLVARTANRTVVDLDEKLEQLPIHDADFREVSSPTTARELQDLNHAAIDGLLEAFEVYFKKDMFLTEKKAIWLRFVGASKELMHKVLD